MNNIYVIAEMCCNHMGNIDYAFEMIDKLVEAPENERVSVIKFQKRHPKSCLSQNDYNAPHPNPKNAFGRTYGEHREFLEFNIQQHQELKSYIEQKGLIYSCSVFDKVSLTEILSLNPEMIKVGSANNIDYELLKIIDKEFQGKKGIHISLGMTTKQEECNILKCFENSLDKVVLYCCTSSYPLQPQDVCLMEIERIKKLYGNEIMAIGFSGHHMSIYPDMAALALGATYFERHYTLNKFNKGTDQHLSLEPEEIKYLVKGLNEVNLGLRYKDKDILDSELDVWHRLKFRMEK